MSQAILIFDFAANEESAQQAWHRAEAWKKGFRLGNKLLVKFERTLEESSSENAKEKSKKKSDSGEGESRIRLLVRLAFSDHEKLSYTRWLDRIPTEEPFKQVEHEIHHQNDPDFDKTVELFDSLD
jgi:siroheme synthase (precorrin-2 oxidase/ferrochelatase)